MEKRIICLMRNFSVSLTDLIFYAMLVFTIKIYHIM